jgi:tetratricopeptide (TPR) repeat protein
MRIAAHVDARQLLTSALEAVKFGLEAEPATLTALLLELALCERVLGTPGYGEHLRRGVSLARQHRLGTMLASAGQLLSPGPGLLPRVDANEVLSAALEALPEDDARNRTMVLCHLSWTPPNCMSAQRVQSLLSQAEAQLERSHSADAHAKLRDAQLFFQAGPSTQGLAEVTAREIEEDLRARPEVARSARVLVIGNTRFLMALQRGDLAGAQLSMERRNEMLEQLHNVELDWHHTRMLLVLRMNHGDFNGVGHELEQLRVRSERLGLQAGRALWARDSGQLLFWTADPKVLAPYVKSGLALSPNDNPLARSYKLRAMVEMELFQEAREALASVSCDALRDLPQDRDYLAVLTQISMAVYALGSREHAEVLYELLAPYATFFGASIAFECVGSVSLFLGQLACVRGDLVAAREHFQHAVTYNERAELRACAVQSQYELARLLLREGELRDVSRARALLADAHEAAIALGLAPLLRAITAAQQS